MSHQRLYMAMLSVLHVALMSASVQGLFGLCWLWCSSLKVILCACLSGGGVALLGWWCNGCSCLWGLGVSGCCAAFVLVPSVGFPPPLAGRCVCVCLVGCSVALSPGMAREGWNLPGIWMVSRASARAKGQGHQPMGGPGTSVPGSGPGPGPGHGYGWLGMCMCMCMCICICIGPGPGQGGVWASLECGFGG